MYLLKSLIINYEILIQFNSWLERDVSTAKWLVTETVQHTNTKNKGQQTGHLSNTNAIIVKEFTRAPYFMILKIASEFNDNRPWTTVDLTNVPQFFRPLFPC
jgi:hypothetical protein